MPIRIPDDISVYYISILILNRTLLKQTTPYGNPYGCAIRDHSDPTAFQGLLRLITDSKQEKTLISQHFLMGLGSLWILGSFQSVSNWFYSLITSQRRKLTATPIEDLSNWQSMVCSFRIYWVHKLLLDVTLFFQNFVLKNCDSNHKNFFLNCILVSFRVWNFKYSNSLTMIH